MKVCYSLKGWYKGTTSMLKCYILVAFYRAPCSKICPPVFILASVAIDII